MEKYSFFDSRNGDRKYNADDWSNYFASLIGNGIFAASNAFDMTVEGSNIIIKSGKAFINGKLYHNTDNLIAPFSFIDDGFYTLAIRLDHRLREMFIYIKQGLALQRDDEGYELSLASITKTGDELTLSDNRNDAFLCGYVKQLVEGISNDFSVINNLTTPSASDALSANMGKTLKELLDSTSENILAEQEKLHDLIKENPTSSFHRIHSR